MTDKLLEKILVEVSQIKEMLSSMEKDILSLKSTEQDSPEPIVETSNPTQKRTKANARINESDDIKFINDAIHKNTPAGQKLKEAFKRKFGKELQDSRQINQAGQNSKHYDFEILVDGSWHTVEHKGSKDYKPIDSSKPPWEQGVQFYNGIFDRYTLGKRYAREWYDRFIASGYLTQKYVITSPIPSFEEWVNKDAKACGDPKTAFGLELRSRFRGDGKSGGCFEERDIMMKEFAILDGDLEIVKDEVLHLAQSVLSQKKYWLQIQGDLENGFYCAWHPELKLTHINKVEKIKEKSDLLLKFECDMGFNIHAMLRWGKGQGLSNLRIDLR
jgi:hypothetical protein